MRRYLVGSTAVAILALVAACGDLNQGTAPSLRNQTATRIAAATAPVPGTCTTYPALVELANDLFGEGSDNANLVISQLNTLAHDVAAERFESAKAHAFSVVEFVLDAYRAGGLPGSAQDAVDLVNSVFCFVGLSIQISDPSSSFFVSPGDGAQILQVPGIAGTSLPPNAVSEPSVITVETIPDTFTAPGAGPLDTKLDQYPGFAHFTLQSENSTGFTQPVIVAVCATPGIPADVRARLRLGHDASTGFEITPAASGAFLQCPTTIGQSGIRGLFGRLANLVLPKVAYARQDDFSGGVGGTAGEYSDFGPIDPNAGLTGGVGGTAGEYIRASALMSLVGACSVVEAPAGSPLPDDCLPLLTITTPLGTPLTGVPIQWTVTEGGGQIAPRSGGVCGDFGSTASTVTSAFGKTGVCWTLGAVGLNRVVATPSVGGDAPAGTNFTPATITFDANALGALQVLNQCPPGGSGDPINAAGKTYALYIPNPGRNKTIREIQMYLSSTGKANVPTPYQIALTTQMGTFDPAVSPPISTITTVGLRGNNSESKLTTFVLSTPIVGSPGGPDIMIRLNVLTNPDGSTITMNTGECPPGKNCNPPPSCRVTEVNSVTPFPSGTFYRKSVALTVKGN